METLSKYELLIMGREFQTNRKSIFLGKVRKGLIALVPELDSILSTH